jgi:hypothetical protein
MLQIRIFFGLFIFLFFISFTFAQWVDDPADCPVIYQSQECPGTSRVCGSNAGITYCYEPSNLLPPSNNLTAIENVDDGSFDSGGYLINCSAYDYGSEPFCDNNEGFWCDISIYCYNTKFRETICLENTFGQSACGDCRTNYVNCSLDDVCEINIGSTCASFATYDGNCNGLVGNCTCIGNYGDCDNNDGDGNILTAWGGNGCEIHFDYTPYKPNSHYVTCDTYECNDNYLDCNGTGDGTDIDGCEINIGGTCGTNAIYDNVCAGTSGNCTCSSNYYDCDNDDGDGNILTTNNLGSGCEIQGGSSCNIGGAQGTYVGCTCVPGKSYFETGTLGSYLTSNPLLWGAQYGTGWLLNLTNSATDKTFGIDNETCIVFSDGSRQCSAGSGGEENIWDNDTSQIFIKIGYPNFLNIFDFLFINKTNNKVGIGTSTPQNELNVIGNVNATGTIYANSFIGDGSGLTGIVGGGGARSYFLNKTIATYDGDDLGNYTAVKNACASEFLGSHICTVNEILDTMMYKDTSTITEWSGTAWIIGGPPGYTADANDCLGWTSSDNDDYGRFWNFDEVGTDDGMGWLTSCNQIKSLACCKEETS